ncbi:hypothetical protein CISIN_1g035323mg [Citrus sinensis]|uniref:Uncharacterized protein n=1 Tax=Citrus sinensis TaxID=2711 RepID=A0A067D8K1_CITSI|nr:hypothetical protein CISIN_1g035323mg [Citrus sinensis]
MFRSEAVSYGESIYAQMTLILLLKGGGTIDLEPYLTHSSTTEPTLAPMAVERTMTTRAAASVGLGLF